MLQQVQKSFIIISLFLMCSYAADHSGTVEYVEIIGSSHSNTQSRGQVMFKLDGLNRYFVIGKDDVSKSLFLSALLTAKSTGTSVRSFQSGCDTDGSYCYPTHIHLLKN